MPIHSQLPPLKAFFGRAKLTEIPMAIKKEGASSFLPDRSPTATLLSLAQGTVSVDSTFQAGGGSSLFIFLIFFCVFFFGGGLPFLTSPRFCSLLSVWWHRHPATQPRLYLYSNSQAISVLQNGPAASSCYPSGVLREGPGLQQWWKSKGLLNSLEQAVYFESHCCFYSWKANRNTSLSYWDGKSLLTLP